MTHAEAMRFLTSPPSKEKSADFLAYVSELSARARKARNLHSALQAMCEEIDHKWDQLSPEDRLVVLSQEAI